VATVRMKGHRTMLRNNSRKRREESTETSEDHSSVAQIYLHIRPARPFSLLKLFHLRERTYTRTKTDQRNTVRKVDGILMGSPMHKNFRNTV